MLEGRRLCITGTTKTFYVNSISGNTLGPRPAKVAAEATTLIGLLQNVSSKFKIAFHELLDLKVSAHPFESVQSPLPPNSWLGEYPISDHKRDAARAEDDVTLSYGSELVAMQRDWNEELQSCREFPHATHQERILRERALYKVPHDFVDAAISGVVRVIRRCIPPINPTDPECFHMYVHNNIFFSFVVDADLRQLTRNQESNTEMKLSSTDLLLNATRSASSKLSFGTIAASDQGEEALKLLSEFHRSGMVPSQSSFTSVLFSCAKMGALEIGRQIHTLTIKIGCQFNSYVGNGLISMYGKCKNLENVSQVFNTMAVKDIVSWNSLMSGFFQNYMLHDARNIFEKRCPRLSLQLRSNSFQITIVSAAGSTNKSRHKQSWLWVLL